MSVGFLGAGRIAYALAKGFVKAGLASGESLFASSPRGPSNMGSDFKKLGAKTITCNTTMASESDVIFITTKANIVPKVLQEISPVLTEKKLIVSVAAGVTIDSIQRNLPDFAKVIRVMTNTPVLVGVGATAYSGGDNVADEDLRVVHHLLSSVGFCVQTDESLLDAVCGLSGSGPAYVYIFIEALTDGGVRMGLPRELSLNLAIETLLGATMMVKETREHPSQLKDNVCSPGGSTITALHGLDSAGFRGLIIDAVKNATIRTTELSQLANVVPNAPPKTAHKSK